MLPYWNCKIWTVCISLTFWLWLPYLDSIDFRFAWERIRLPSISPFYTKIRWILKQSSKNRKQLQQASFFFLFPPQFFPRSPLVFITLTLFSSVEHARSLGIDPNEYRIICRNGTLADRNGFDVEQRCALTTIVDGEVVVAQNNHKTSGILNALISFDKYFQKDPDFKMYNSFSGEQNLLFKVSVMREYSSVSALRMHGSGDNTNR